MNVRSSITRMDKLDDSKFGHLLQPIRDLAANWDINIANELEDYLVRLSMITLDILHGRLCSCRP